ncbi:MAG: hypothetical protein FD138_2491 [Planctomycetota bacterium]|nr:MAG: hypothetical protein FD138_2491 [Planctomycetota bacterium]
MKNYVLANFQKFEVQQPGTPQPVPVRKIGISHAVFKSEPPKQFAYFPKGKKSKGATTTKSGPGGFGNFGRPNTGAVPPTTTAGLGGVDGQSKDGEERRMINKNDFVIQFIWIPTSLDKRPTVDPLKPAAPEGATPADPANNSAAPTNALAPNNTTAPTLGTPTTAPNAAAAPNAATAVPGK